MILRVAYVDESTVLYDVDSKDMHFDGNSYCWIIDNNIVIRLDYLKYFYFTNEAII